jgi:hypothetical protein
MVFVAFIVHLVQLLWLQAAPARPQLRLPTSACSGSQTRQVDGYSLSLPPLRRFMLHLERGSVVFLMFRHIQSRELHRNAVGSFRLAHS